MTGFRFLLFWLSRQPDADPERMTFTMWNTFLDSMSSLLVICVLLIVLLAVIGYASHARHLRIVHPKDYFRPYTPLRWPLLLPLIIAALLFWQYVVQFKRMFPKSPVSPVGGAVQVAIWGWLLAFLLARLIVMSRGITPAKFRYRPLQWVIPSGRLAANGGKR